MCWQHVTTSNSCVQDFKNAVIADKHIKALRTLQQFS